MRPAIALDMQVLTADFNHHFVADLFYDGRRRIASIPLTDFSLTEDADALIQQSGSCTVVWTDEWASSLSPETLSDPLAPAGAELWVYSVITTGPTYKTRVPLGQYRITNIPSAMDEEMLFNGQRITLGSVVKVEFKERLIVVADDRFDLPEATASLSSVWGEVGRISNMQIVRNLPDSTIPRTITYGEERIDGVYDLLELIGGIPHVLSDGTLAARPINWPDPVATLRRGTGGQIVSVGRSMSTALVYNRVVVRGKAQDQTIVLASSEITSGPLRVRNADGSRAPFGRKTKFVSSDYVTTYDQAKPWADRELAASSRLRSTIVPVVATFNPFWERGDVVILQRGARDLIGRISKIERKATGTMKMNVEVVHG
jgi:hypothetical protein